MKRILPLLLLLLAAMPPPLVASAVAEEHEYTPRGRIVITNDSQFCTPDGNGGWVDRGVVNCATADGSREKPYVISGWAIDAGGVLGVYGSAIVVANNSKNVTIERNFLRNGSAVPGWGSGGIWVKVRPNEQDRPAEDWPHSPLVRIRENDISGFRYGITADGFGRTHTLTSQTFRIIEDNLLVGNTHGLSMQIQSTIRHNLITSSVIAVYISDVDGNHVVENNTITDSPKGIILQSCHDVGLDPVVRFNNFRNLSEYALEQRGCDPVIGTDNWWGNPDGPRYQRLQVPVVEPILDGWVADETGEGGRVTWQVLFAPWRSEPVATAGARAG